MRDTNRSAVYAAEIDAFGQTLVDEPIGFEAVVTLAGMLFSHPWWYEATAGLVPLLAPARANARRSTARREPSGTWLIGLAACHLDAATLAHEAAHVLCGVHHASPTTEVAAHGREFRTAHLDVTEVVLGSHGRRLLHTAYRAARLDTLVVAPWPVAPTELPFGDEHGLFGRWRTAIAL